MKCPDTKQECHYTGCVKTCQRNEPKKLSWKPSREPSLFEGSVPVEEKRAPRKEAKDEKPAHNEAARERTKKPGKQKGKK